MSFDDLQREILEQFAEAQDLASDVRGFATDRRTGEIVRELDDTWTGRALAYRCEYHREMAELRARRPVYLIKLDPRIQKLPRRNSGGTKPATPWSPLDDDHVLDLWLRRVPMHEIARRLERTESAVYQRILMLRAHRSVSRLVDRR